MQPQGDAPQEWRGLRQHPVSSRSAHHPTATNPLCTSLFLLLKTSLHSRAALPRVLEPGCPQWSVVLIYGIALGPSIAVMRMQASTQQVFQDLLSQMADQNKRNLTILLLGEVTPNSSPFPLLA